MRKQLKLTPEVRERLTRPTVERAPVRYVPLTKKEVRAHIPSNERPKRTVNGKPKRATSSEITAELNQIEKRLNSHGYSLRDSRSVVYHEHQPDRAVLDEQVLQVERVVQEKPKRAPLNDDQLRAKFRREAKPTRKPPARSSAGAKNLLLTGNPTPLAPSQASASFGWKPMIGEPDLATVFLDTRSQALGQFGGADPGLRVHTTLRAGATILSEPYEAFRLDADVAWRSSGDSDAQVTVTLMGGYQQQLFDTPDQNVSVSESQTIYDYPNTYETVLFIAGYPIDIDLTVTPTMSVGYGAYVVDGGVLSSVTPKVQLKLTLEAYLDLFLVQAGAGGHAVLLDVGPTIHGVAYYTEIGDQISVLTETMGTMKVSFLAGRVYAFLKVGIGWFSTRFEFELMDYPGWSYAFPFYDSELSNES